MARRTKTPADAVVKRQEISIELCITDYDTPLTLGDVKRWVAAVEAAGATDSSEINDDCFLNYELTTTDSLDEAS